MELSEEVAQRGRKRMRNIDIYRLASHFSSNISAQLPRSVIYRSDRVHTRRPYYRYGTIGILILILKLTHSYHPLRATRRSAVVPPFSHETLRRSCRCGCICSFTSNQSHLPHSNSYSYDAQTCAVRTALLDTHMQPADGASIAFRFSQVHSGSIIIIIRTQLMLETGARVTHTHTQPQKFKFSLRR